MEALPTLYCLCKSHYGTVASMDPCLRAVSPLLHSVVFQIACLQYGPVYTSTGTTVPAELSAESHSGEREHMTAEGVFFCYLICIMSPNSRSPLPLAWWKPCQASSGSTISVRGWDLVSALANIVVPAKLCSVDHT